MNIPTFRVLSRKRVNRELNNIFSFPLTVIRAPMGFGKTTALHEFVRIKKIKPIWLSLMGSGGSLAYFWGRLTSKIAKVNPALGMRFENLGFPSDISQMVHIFNIIYEIEYERPVMVVIDDYHLIDCPQIASLITLISNEHIPNLHIVLVAQYISSLQITDLSQKRVCFLVEQDVLQFQPDEIYAYFKLMECPMNNETLTKVHRWTGGWISGIYLIQQSLRQGLPIVRGESIDRLLERNLYNTHDEETKLFLQKLSFLDIFTPEQATYAMNDLTAPQRILFLAQGNAFISYNKAYSAYQMTSLLQEFLQEKARNNNIDPRTIYQRMGQWFLREKKRSLAYDYLLRAGDIVTILHDLNREQAQDIHFAQFPQIHMIFEGLSEEASFRYPIASLRNVRVKALTCNPYENWKLEQQLAKMEHHFIMQELSESERSRILGEIHNTWIFVAFNSAQAVVGHATKAVEYFRGRYSCIVSNATEFTFGAPHLLYCYYTKKGSLKQTASFISAHFHILAEAVEGCGSGSEPLTLAEYSLETGDFDNVAINARKAIYQAQSYNQNAIIICATFTLARLKLFQGKFNECQELITRLTDIMERLDSSVLNTTCGFCIAYLNGCLGLGERIPEWIQNNDMAPANFMFQGIAFNYIVCAKSILLSGDYIRLEVLCEEAQEKLSIYNNQLGYISNYIFSAIAKNALYGEKAGQDALRKALEIAADDHIVLPFAENGVYIQSMLAALRDTEEFPQEYMDYVIYCCKQYQEYVSTIDHGDVILSEREQEVIHLLADGYKHKEIAEKLFISVATVRYHVRNVYKKLNVNNTVSALRKASDLKLV